MENAVQQNDFMTADVVNTKIAEVYRIMAGGLMLSAGFGYATLMSELLHLMSTSLGWVLVIGQFVLMLVISFGGAANKFSAATLRVLFYVLSATFGLTLASVLASYTAASVGQAFVIASVTFGAAALYGYVTKRSLSGLGSILAVALLGVAIACLVNLFVRSGVLQLIVDIISVVVFTALASYDSQRLRDDLRVASGEQADRVVAMGAFSMYLNLLNLFLLILRLTGSRED